MNKHGLPAVLVALVCAIFSMVAFAISPGLYETGDGVAHFQISKWSWSHHELFLHQWGKPLFTTLSSAFAQFGYAGMVSFNIILFLLSSWFFYKVCRHYKCRGIWFGILIMFCAPVYARMVLAGMTEVLFATLYLGTIWSFTQKKYALGALIFGFSLLSRPEALVLLPLVGLYLLLKEWKSTPLLLVGLLVYGVCTFIVFQDPLWFIHADPYDPNGSIYGSGEFMKFFASMKSIIGIPAAIILICSLLVYALKTDIRKSADTDELAFSVLIIGGFFLVFLTHSFLWWKGIKGSMGLIRVIATVTPLAALISMRGWTFLIEKTDSRKYLSYGLTLVFAVLMVHTLWARLDLPHQQDMRVERITKALDGIEIKDGQRILYLDPWVTYQLGIDPYDQSKSVMIWSADDLKKEVRTGRNDIVVWESHFMRTEGGIALEEVAALSELTLIREENGPQDVMYMGAPYQVRIYQAH
jgi:hypothetical protein